MKRKIFSIAESLGLEDQLMDLHLRQKNSLTNSLQTSVDPKIRKWRGKYDKGEVIIPQFGTKKEGYIIRSIFAHAFRTRGYKPKMVFHGSLPHEKTYEKRKTDVRATEERYYATEVSEKFNLELVNLENREDEHQIEEIRETDEKITYRDVEISRYARSKTRKICRSYRLKDKRSQQIFNSLIPSLKTMVDWFKEELRQNEVSAVLADDAMYLPGVYLDIAENKDISTATVGQGWRPNRLIFGKRSNECALPHFTDKSYLEEKMKNQLSQDEKRNVEKRLEERRKGQDRRTNHTKYAQENIEMEEDDREIYIAFTNLLWDGSLANTDDVFNSPIEWIEQTIEIFREIEDKKLLIKTHPGEKIRFTRESFQNIIRDEIENLPENIEILSPDTDLNPYDLMKYADKGIVYNSTAGLEMALEDKPVIVTGITHYTGLGFTNKPESKEEYGKMLEGGKELIADRERALRYAHHLFINKHIKFNWLDNTENLKVTPPKHDNLIPRNEPYDTIVKNIIEGESVVQDEVG